jgi:hypothetical protein
MFPCPPCSTGGAAAFFHESNSVGTFDSFVPTSKRRFALGVNSKRGNRRRVSSALARSVGFVEAVVEGSFELLEGRSHIDTEVLEDIDDAVARETEGQKNRLNAEFPRRPPKGTHAVAPVQRLSTDDHVVVSDGRPLAVVTARQRRVSKVVLPLQAGLYGHIAGTNVGEGTKIYRLEPFVSLEIHARIEILDEVSGFIIEVFSKIRLEMLAQELEASEPVLAVRSEHGRGHRA